MMDAIREEFQEITVLKLVQWCSALAMVFGGVVPYVPQYRQIKKTDNADGFSLHVCLALLIANILRILYWFGHGFELPLLAQSVVMIVAMMTMVKLCVEVKNRTQIIRGKDRIITGHGGTSSQTPRHTFFDFDWDYFWKWTEFQSYVEFLLFFTAVTTVALYLLIDSVLFVETVGVLAVFTESLLGVPQLLQNINQQSTQGMSIGMVLMWLSGDFFKTLYFIVRSAPKQFMMAGMLQVGVDIFILLQVWYYGSNLPNHSVSSGAAPRHKAQELVK